MFFVSLALAEPLPAQRPADFSVHYEYGGGMTQYSVDERCDTTGCVLDKVSAEGRPTYLVGTATPADLDACWAALVAHHADAIRTERTGPTNDAPSVTVTLTAGGHTWAFGSGYTSDIADASAADYQAIVTAIDTLVAKSARTKAKRPTP